MELGVGIDEENLAAAILGLIRVGRLACEIRPHDEDARRNARAVEKVRRQADDRLDQILFEKLLADLFLRIVGKSTP